MRFVFTPDWFLGKDVLIDVFSFFILAAFFILATQSYRLNKKKSSLFLGLGFLLIALAQLSSVLTRAVLYYDTTITQSIGQAVITYQVIKSVDLFYYVGFFFHKLLTVFGLFFIYKLPLKKETKKDFLFMSFLLFMTIALSSNLHYIFYFTSLILTIFIIRNYSVVYKKNKNKNTKLLLMGFYGLAISQAIFIFSNLAILYVAADLIELVSYSIFLIVIGRIFTASKKINKKSHK
ncbi:hypothetical protein ACFLZZ_02745 [Nanoarchaeota archaeon]